MADLRGKLRANTEQFLEPGENIQAVFLVQTGPTPYLFLLTYLLAFWTKYYAMVVTDRRILLLKASIWRQSDVKAVVDTLPRQTRFGPVSGLWGKIEIGDRRYWVHKRFHKDVAQADAALPGLAERG